MLGCTGVKAYPAVGVGNLAAVSRYVIPTFTVKFLHPAQNFVYTNVLRGQALDFIYTNVSRRQDLDLSTQTFAVLALRTELGSKI